jgi:hypothetical protein
MDMKNRTVKYLEQAGRIRRDFPFARAPDAIHRQNFRAKAHVLYAGSYEYSNRQSKKYHTP